MHIAPTQAAGAAFFGAPPPGPITMLNLLRFAEVADYSQHEELAPQAAISGRQAYERYVECVMPLLAKAGSELLMRGTGGPYLIGPAEAQWDLVLLVRHVSAAAFLSFASDPDYRAIAGHRTAALADSRLLPLSDLTLPATSA